MFFYRFMLFSFILRNIKSIFTKLVYLAIFSYCVSFIFITMKDGISVAFSYKNPKDIVVYAYTYLKWCYYNYNSLTYSTFFKMGVSLIVPFWLYLKISKINWKKFFRSLYEYICFLFKRNGSNANIDVKLGNDNVVNDGRSIRNNYRNEMYNIKKKAMINIEGSIDRMISEILCLKSKKAEEESDKKNDIINGR